MEDAVLAYYRGDFNSSIEMFYLIINDDPQNRSAGLSLAVLLMEAGRHEEAYTVLSDYKDPVPGNTFPDGAIWEDPSLPLFLSGNSREYLETPPPALSGNAREILQREITAEKLFFRGWALSDAGRGTDEAVKSMEEALKLREYFPAANMMLGIIHYEKENYKESEHYLNLALKQDNNLTGARPYLARAILEQGRIAEAYSAFSRVRATRPWDTHSAALMKKLEEENPSLTAAAAQAAETRRVIASAPQAARFTAEPEAMPFVRIGLGENLREIYIKTGGAFKLTDSSDRLLHEGGKDTILKVNITSAMIDFFPEKSEGKSAAQSAGPVTLSYDNKESTTIMFDISYSTGYQSAGQEDRAYRGTITFIPKSRSAMTVINTLPIEEYLYSVVPSEMPSWWPPEALAAQAVSARTYTLAHMNRYQSRGFDLLGSIASAF